MRRPLSNGRDGFEFEFAISGGAECGPFDAEVMLVDRCWRL